MIAHSSCRCKRRRLATMRKFENFVAMHADLIFFHKNVKHKYLQSPNAVADRHLHWRSEWNTEFPTKRHFGTAAHSVLLRSGSLSRCWFPSTHRPHRKTGNELKFLSAKNARFLGIHKCDFLIAHKTFPRGWGRERERERGSLAARLAFRLKQKFPRIVDRIECRMYTDCPSSFFDSNRKLFTYSLSCRRMSRLV